jgi:hypothetical protein
MDSLEDDFFDLGGETESNTVGDSTDGGFELPGFDDVPGDFTAEPEDTAVNDSGFEDDGFHLDDFLDEADLDLPETESGELADSAEFAIPETDFPDFDDFAGPETDMDDSNLPSTDSGDSPVPAADAPASSGTGGPNGLYSPRSNIGWEAYTRDRLDSELHICASSEQDLVVLLIECGDGVNCDGTLYKKIADTAVELFNLKDLTFEYGERGITVIIPNAGLEQGIAKAEGVHTRLFKNCPESFHAKSDLLAGISSRSGRLIEADRLMLEASRALEKAKVDSGSPIVAFKSDPEKYREYLQKESL